MVSVIMSVYNEELDMIKKSVQSILSQSYTGELEIIIIVDNPKNKQAINLLKEFQEKYKNIKIIINNENKGLAYSLNLGIENANGEYICRMDADDISFKNRVELQMRFLNDNDLDFVSSFAIPIDENDKVIDGIIKVPTTNKGINMMLRYTSCLVHPTWLFKKNIFNEINGYRNCMIASQDYDFAIRMSKKGFKLGTISEPLLYYRIRSNAISTSKRALQTYLALYSQDNVYRGCTFDENVTTNINSDKDLEYLKFKHIFEKFINNYNLMGKIYWSLLGCIISKIFRRFIFNTLSAKFIKSKVLQY